ncbi:carboxypeptidase-like regulatory domain-containing protein [Flavivirga amylovorans]|uniref:Carboxypeptidase-like regulatory domain-containing protein n=1 Tax=Flavivirga amylovorans TaxID=870486 RepID=A0ABT8X083_9FLAO|nr:carboxypeptidase-like regulatory domain-containing protein [Flavivirga amylovorans]MDO5987348.1 carboxypeptidase-like regulatory domain-containing protein [Flavivirga amylovorans]
MKIIKITCLFILLSHVAFCQSKEKISITFNEVEIVEALSELERVSSYKFYFNKTWFNNSFLISKSFNDVSLEDVLTEILEDTTINYFVLNGKIILTNNNIIRDKLPPNFFGTELTVEAEEIEEEVDKVPVLKKQYLNRSKINKTKIFYIGKESESSSQKMITLSGYIKDEKTKKPIQNLDVFIQGTSINTVTNNLGYYSLKVPMGFNVLEIASLAYGKHQKQIVVYGKGTLSFQLSEATEQLEEVVIKSDRNENIKSATVGVTKIDVKGIKNIPLILGERDVLKVATTMPGIKTAGEGALGYSVRGGKVDQNLILFDGAAIYNPSHFFGVFSAINPFATGSVDIYKGSIPAEFGGKLSSVIDISTKEANMEKFSGEGNIGPVTGNLLIETPIIKDKISVLVGGRATYSDWVLKAISEESIKNSKANFYDAIIKFNYKINEKNDLQATGYYSNDEFSITSDSVYNYSNRIGSIKWDHKFNDKNRLTTQLASSQYKFNIIYDGIFNRNFDFGYSINETELKLKAKYLYSKKHKFSYGLSSKLYSIKPGDIVPLGGESVIERKSVDKERGLESALFISNLFEVNDKLLLDIGFRYSFYAALGASTQNVYDPTVPISAESIIETKTYEENEVIKTYGGPEVRFSARYFLTPSISIKGGYNRTIQYSHLLSSNTTASPVDSWKLSDLNIEPQRAEQFSLGLYKNFDDGIHELSIEGYYKKMKNLLDFKIGAELLLNQDIETELLQGDGKAYGIEFLLKKKEGRLNGWLGYSYSRSFVKLDSEFLTNQINSGDYFAANQDRPHDVSLVSNYKLTKRYSFSLNFNYQSGRPITYPVGKYIYNGEEQVLYSDRNKFRIPDYYRLDLGVNIEGNHKNVKLAHSFWNISVYNVLGRNNPYSVFFVNENGQIKGYKSSIFSIPVPTITYNFKF